MADSYMGCCVDKACVPGTCMCLPDGMTCHDCVHVDRCVAMFGVQPSNAYCDFFPRRFSRAAPADGKGES